MTDDPITAFRQNNELVGQAAELLNNPLMKRMILLVKDAGVPVDAPLNSEAVASARVLSQSVGWNGALTALLSLSVPATNLPELGEETWGNDLPTTTGTA